MFGNEDDGEIRSVFQKKNDVLLLEIRWSRNKGSTAGMWPDIGKGLKRGRKLKRIKPDDASICGSYA